MFEEDILTEQTYHTIVVMLAAVHFCSSSVIRDNALSGEFMSIYVCELVVGLSAMLPNGR
jgi:hypothetical protein